MILYGDYAQLLKTLCLVLLVRLSDFATKTGVNEGAASVNERLHDRIFHTFQVENFNPVATLEWGLRSVCHQVLTATGH